MDLASRPACKSEQRCRVAKQAWLADSAAGRSFISVNFSVFGGRDGRKICPFPGMRGSVFEGLFYMGKSSVARFLSVIERFPSLRSSSLRGFTV